MPCAMLFELSCITSMYHICVNTYINIWYPRKTHLCACFNGIYSVLCIFWGLEFGANFAGGPYTKKTYIYIDVYIYIYILYIHTCAHTHTRNIEKIKDNNFGVSKPKTSWAFQDFDYFTQIAKTSKTTQTNNQKNPKPQTPWGPLHA